MALNSKSLRIAGKVFISVNGVGIPCKQGVEIDFGDEEKEPVIGLDGVHGFSGKATAPGIKFTATNRNDMNVHQLLRQEGATVVAQAEGGKTYTLRDAWQSGRGTLNMDDGELPLQYNGLALEEI